MRDSEHSEPQAAESTLPEWGLFVREPFAARIIAGRKTWELRKRSTPRRGRIAILSERGILGTVDLHDVLGPFTVESLAMHVNRHRAPLTLLDRYAAGLALYAWVLRAPIRFDRPIAHRPGRGPVVWFKLPESLRS